MKLFITLLLVPLLITTQQKVYICKSSASYAYHAKMCQGLRKCTHEIVSVTVKEAIESRHKKPCGYCYVFFRAYPHICGTFLFLQQNQVVYERPIQERYLPRSGSGHYT
jgi:hypothetical protein